MNSVDSYRKVDDFTFELTTKSPDALIPYYFARIFFASPTQWEKVGRGWAEFAKAPAATGPRELDKLIPRERAAPVRNTAYCDKARTPQTHRRVPLPIPDAVTRTSP